ncbi:MAG: diguanylate cyclase [Clostridiales bacterium]|nr:diguanylate cyclase [Clostridiales bacterium]
MNSKEENDVRNREKIIFWEYIVHADSLNFFDTINNSGGNELYKIEMHLIGEIVEFLNNNLKNIIKDEIQRNPKAKALKLNEHKIEIGENRFAWLMIDGNYIYNEKNELLKIDGIIQNITTFKKNYDEISQKGNFLKNLIEIVKDPIFYKDNKGIYKFCNQAYCSSLGLDVNDIIGHDVYDVFQPVLAEIFNKADISLTINKKEQAFESKIPYSDGLLHDVIISKVLDTDEFGNAIGILGYLKDITEQKYNMKQAEKREMIKELFLDINQNVGKDIENTKIFDVLLKGLINIFDDANYGSVLEVVENKILKSISSVGYASDSISNFEIELKDSFIYRLSKGNLTESKILRNICDIDDYLSPEYATTSDGKIAQTTMYIPVEIDQDTNWFICLDSFDNNGFNEFDLTIADYVKMQVPILHHIFELNKERLMRSRYDDLTGLMNRRYFNVLLQDRMEIAKRNNSECVLMIADLDGLKKINDLYGHHIGDEYIKEFAYRSKYFFRASDIFSRIGGDEFSGVFLTLNKKELIAKITEFQKQFENEAIIIDNIEFYGGFSFGIAILNDDSNGIDELLRIADERMYVNKKARKNFRFQ